MLGAGDANKRGMKMKGKKSMKGLPKGECHMFTLAIVVILFCRRRAERKTRTDEIRRKYGEPKSI